jgi:hypothetical protein
MAQHDALSEDDVATHGAEDEGIEQASEHETERTRYPGTADDEFEEDQLEEAGASYDQILIFPERANSSTSHLGLDLDGAARCLFQY